MSQLQVDHAELEESANAAQAAAARARGHGSSSELTTAGGAVPGAASVDYLRSLGTSWDEEVDAWSSDVRAFGDELAAAGEDYKAADATAGGLFGALLGGG